MPRSAREIIEHADVLAEQFENYDPKQGDEGRVSPQTRLRLAALRRSEAEAEVVEAVKDAREHSVPWSAIGEVLGTSGEAARQRYAEASR